MNLTLKIKDNFYTEPDKKGRVKIIKKDVVTTLDINSTDIVSVSQIVDDNGNLLRDFSRLFIKEMGPVIVNHSVNEIKRMKEPKVNKIGFKTKNKNNKK